MKLDPQPRDLCRLVDELSDFYHPQAQQAGVVLRTQLPKEPIIAKVDEGLLKQAVLNLMLNATQAMARDGFRSPVVGDQFAVGTSQSGARGPTDHRQLKTENSPRPTAELILRVERDEREARIHVIDTGPGIEAAKVNEIFRPYFSMRQGGTGLGLPTAQRIVQEHGGELIVHSEPGKGSDFTIHLPVEPAAPDTEIRRPAQP